MKPLCFVPLVCMALVLTGCGKKPPPRLVIPDALRMDETDPPAGENQLSRFLEHPPLPPELVQRTSAAMERLDRGEAVDDEKLLDELRGRHRLARETLKAPLAFGTDVAGHTVALFGLVQGSSLLARDAMLRGNTGEADAIHDDLLGWSRLLRHAGPNMVQWMIPRHAWATAFNGMLADLPQAEDPAGRLDFIRAKFRGNPIGRSELEAVMKAEARWWVAEGGLRAMIDREESPGMMTWFLKPPFDRLTAEELAALRYDVEADFQRAMSDLIGNLDALRRGAPLIEWPALAPRHVSRTLADYQKRGNGLGDLFYEQTDGAMSSGFWVSALGSGPLMEGCLRWLEAERAGGEVNAELFHDLLDPLDGGPLTVDPDGRTLRSRGVNRKIDPPDPEQPKPGGGLWLCGDDWVIIVPKVNFPRR